MATAPDSSRRVLDICKEKCAIHSDKAIQFFCETCNKLGCHVCVTLDHRHYDQVKYIPDIAKGFEHSDEFTAFYKGITSTADKLSKLEQDIKLNVTSNNEMQKLAKQELKRQRAEVNMFFDQLEKQMDDQIEMIEKLNKDNLKAASDRLERMKTVLEQIKTDIEAKRPEQNCELFISIKSSKEKMENFYDQFNKLQEELRIRSYAVLPSEQIQSIMRTTTEICRISTATLESMIGIKTNKDETKPNIYSLTIMHGHYCVVADNENKSIKVVDTKTNCVTSEIGIRADYIWSVASVGDDQVAASVSLSSSLLWRERIHFFSVSASGDIQSTNQLHNVDYFYMDMVHCNGNIYGVCGIRTDVLDMTGKIINRIQTDDKGDNLFCVPERIALSPDGQTIYVTDCRKHSVTSLTLDGKVKAIYTDKHLKEPRGITVDKYGYVYVGMIGTHNILQLTADLNKVQVLIDDVYGWNMTYSGTENKLYIDDNNTIKQYSLDFK